MRWLLLVGPETLVTVIAVVALAAFYAAVPEGASDPVFMSRFMAALPITSAIAAGIWLVVGAAHVAVQREKWIYQLDRQHERRIEERQKLVRERAERVDALLRSEGIDV